MAKGHIKNMVQSLSKQGLKLSIPMALVVSSKVRDSNTSELEIEMSQKFEADTGKVASEGSAKEL